MDIKHLLGGLTAIIGKHEWGCLDVLYEDTLTGTRQTLMYIIPNSKTDETIEYIKNGMDLFNDPVFVVHLILLRCYLSDHNRWEVKELYHKEQPEKLKLDQKTKDGEWIV